MNGFDERTKEALDQNLLDKLRNNRFCVVGCGGTGANFAEMLVRTGATELDLIDGEVVKRSDLNRVFAYSEFECDENKAIALEKRLRDIRPGELSIQAFSSHLKTPEQAENGSETNDSIRNAIKNAYAVFIAIDNRDGRLLTERLCREEGSGRYLSCGVRINPTNNEIRFLCNWIPNSPEKDENYVELGYGPRNGSFASIVMEASSVAFTMLLAHLHNPRSEFLKYSKSYDAEFYPELPRIN